MKFEILVEETCMTIYEVEAESEDDAIKMVEGKAIDSGVIINTTIENIINIEKMS